MINKKEEMKFVLIITNYHSDTYRSREEKTELLHHKIVSGRKILKSTVTHRQEYATNS
jgi:hypothetical protein